MAQSDSSDKGGFLDAKAAPSSSTGEQLDLPIDPEFLKAAERKGEYTGARLFEKFPEKYKTCVHLLAEGIGQIRIGRMLGISPNSVRGVRDREGTAVDIEKRRSAGVWADVARLSGERMLEKLEDDDEAKKIPFNHLGVGGGIAEDKTQLLTGGVTQRVETRPAAPTAEDFRRYLESLPAAEQVSIEEPAANRLHAETGEQTREDDGADPAGTLDEQSSEPAGRDQPESETGEK